MTVLADTAPIQAALVDLLTAQQSTISSLRKVVEREQHALAKFDSEQLASLSTEKYDLLLRLENWARRWHKLASNAGYIAARGTMQEWIDAQRNSTMSSLWQDLKNATQDVRFNNEINGNLIASQLNHVEQQFSALHNTASPRQLYGADGISYRNATTRTIAAV